MPLPKLPDGYHPPFAAKHDAQGSVIDNNYTAVDNGFIAQVLNHCYLYRRPIPSPSPVDKLLRFKLPHDGWEPDVQWIKIEYCHRPGEAHVLHRKPGETYEVPEGASVIIKTVDHAGYTSDGVTYIAIPTEPPMAGGTHA